jgi:DNA (cytosine-5)-methyltransferase 1
MMVVELQSRHRHHAPAMGPSQFMKTDQFSRGVSRGIRDAIKPQPTLVSLFSGAGGLDLGLEQAGFRTLLANEVEPYACESLRSNRVLRSLTEDQFETWFREHVLSQRCYKTISTREEAVLRRRLFSALRTESYLNHADIVERDVSFLPADEVLSRIGMKRGQLDVIAGGPPCQPFSRSGKREMVDCDKGQLFMQFVRLVDGVRPRWFVFENVKGLVIHKADVASFGCPKCGAVSISNFESRDQLKDATTHQHRCQRCGHEGPHSVIWDNRRAGSLDIIKSEFQRLGYSCVSSVLNAANYGAPQIRERLFIIGSRDGEFVNWPEETHSNMARLADNEPSLFDQIPAPLKPWRTLNEALYETGHWRYGTLDERHSVLWLKNVVRPHDEPVMWKLDRPAPTIGAHQSAKLAIAPLGVPEEQLARQQWHILGRRQGDTAPVFVEHEYLTDEELLTLQTFPVSWYLHGTRMQRAFQIGNAVPPILARAVGSAIVQAMGLNENLTPTEEGIHGTHYATSI